MIEKVIRKSLDIKYSGRSSDYITPSFGFGCLYKCGYCYMRRHRPEGLEIATNTQDILSAIDQHLSSLGQKEPNQTHPDLWTYDISCNEDFALHAKHHDVDAIFDYFVNYTDRAMGTFATKYVNKDLLKYDPKQRIRIRFSLMPQQLSTVLEPNTSKIVDRIKAVNDFIEAGYDVHLNFSPVIFNPGTGDLYKELFFEVQNLIKPQYKSQVKAEVILLTHNEKLHLYNLSKGLKDTEDLLWHPERQRLKQSSYGSINLRYNPNLKKEYIQKFKQLHSSIIPWNTIRYIF